MAKTITEVLEMAKGTEVVDIRFIDLPGTWQHFTMPAHRLTEDFFEDGIPFDGSSIRGFQEIHESDMLLKADPDTAFIDPTAEISTLVLSCNVFDPLTLEAYSRDPRYVALKAEEYLKSTGIADTAYFAPEAEFFVFDGVRYSSGTNEAFYSIDSEEAWWESGRSDRPNYRRTDLTEARLFPRPAHGYITDSPLQVYAGHGKSRRSDGPAPSRSCHRRSERNEHDLHHAHPHGR